jgi:hypothetical protein
MDLLGTPSSPASSVGGLYGFPIGLEDQAGASLSVRRRTGRVRLRLLGLLEATLIGRKWPDVRQARNGVAGRHGASRSSFVLTGWRQESSRGARRLASAAARRVRARADSRCRSRRRELASAAVSPGRASWALSACMRWRTRSRRTRRCVSLTGARAEAAAPAGPSRSPREARGAGRQCRTSDSRACRSRSRSGQVAACTQGTRRDVPPSRA